jgi:hexosaminidase
LGQVEPVKKVVLGCLQNLRSWIFFPTRIEVFISEDGSRFTPQGTIKIGIKKELGGSQIRDFALSLDGKKTRFIKVVAKNIGICPPWHPGNGEKAWIFVDEILIR